MSDLDILTKRKEKLFTFLKSLTKYKEEFSFLGLIILMIYSFIIRVSNLPILKDITNGQYIPGDPDAAAFLRYAKYVVENGSLMANDTMRYYPLGFSNLDEFNLLSHFIAYLYKVLHFFNENITLNYVDVIFPAITFAIALIPFYFLVKKLFNYKVALLASAYLSFTPQFLYRTISGVGDKEALGIVFLFSSFYFFVLSIKTEKKYGYLFGLLAGICTALLGATWGGVNILFLIIGGTILLKIIFDNLTKKEFYAYSLWWFSTFLLLNRFYNYYYNFNSIYLALTSEITLIALISGFLYYLIKHKNIFNIKEKLNLEKYPLGLVSFIITISVGLVIILFSLGPGFVYDRILNSFIDLTRPFSRNRWALTVAESQQPYINSWFSDFGSIYMYLVLIASIIVFYECFKKIKYKYELTAFYTVFIFSFLFSRYSSNSILDGKSTISLTLYIGSLILFSLIILSYFLYVFYKNKDFYNTFTQIDSTHIFILVWFLITAISARSALRLVFIFVPVTTVLASYIIMKTLDYGLQTTDKIKKIISIILVCLIIFAPFVDGSLVEVGKVTIETAKRTGPSFDQQWQLAMSWVKENTPKESVFAHWWDYGYWVQTFGERATLSDGGNARGAINHFIGRHLLTGRNRTEALELLKTHQATHLLIVSDEIGKYTAFSSIGADENYDRYSYIPNFMMNPNEVQEGRDSEGREITSYLYRGTFVLDEDFIYNGKLFPKGSSMVAGVIIPTRAQGNLFEMSQPTAILFYQNTRQDVPLNCVFLNKQEYKFNNENGYDGCLRILPVVDENGNANLIQGALFLSPNTRNTLFSQLYLFDKNTQNNEDWKGFEKVYDDTEKGYALAYYSKYGRLIGPLKIWKISYSPDIKENPIYLKTEVPNPAVERV